MESNEARAAAAVAAAILVTLGLQWVLGKIGAAPASDGHREKGKDGLELHLVRRVQHAATGLLFVAVSESEILTEDQVSYTLAGCAMWFLSVHFMRLRVPQLQEFLVASFASIARPHEIHGAIPSAFYFLLSSAICSGFMKKPIFHLAVLMLSFGDPAAGIVGKVVARIRRKSSHGKSLAGTLGAWMICSMVTAIYQRYFTEKYASTFHAGVLDSLLYIVIAGLIGALAERVNLGVDDNLSMPLLCGIGLQLLELGIEPFYMEAN